MATRRTRRTPAKRGLFDELVAAIASLLAGAISLVVAAIAWSLSQLVALLAGAYSELSDDHRKDGAGLLLLGLVDVPIVVAMAYPGTAWLAAIHNGVFALIGYGWPLFVVGIGFGGLALIHPPAGRGAKRFQVLAFIVAGLALLGILTVISTPAGGFAGRAISVGLVQGFGSVGAIRTLLGVMGLTVGFALRPRIARAWAQLWKHPEIAKMVEAASALHPRALLAERKGAAVAEPEAPAPPAVGVEQAEDEPVPVPGDAAEVTKDEPAPSKAEAAKTEAPPTTPPTVQGDWVRESPTEYALPPRSLLDAVAAKAERDRAEVKGRGETILAALAQFKLPAEMIGVDESPSLDRFKLRVAVGDVAKAVSLKEQLAYALAADQIHIGRIPGEMALGVDVPRKASNIVTLREVVESAAWRRKGIVLPIALGHDVTGRPVVVDLVDLVHLLIGGATGKGKSVFVNAILCGLLCALDPTRLRFVMVDPKRVELGGYGGLPHMARPLAVDPGQALGVLKWAVAMMEWRYSELARAGVRNIALYNEVAGRKRLRPMPYIVLVIDELADLMMASKDRRDEAEELICRIAQMARAIGIHLVLATQSPRVDIVTGNIKANLPARIAFGVGSQADSRVILDANGAEDLMGKGDMLFRAGSSSNVTRIQGPYLSEREMEAIQGHWAAQPATDYMETPEAAPEAPVGRFDALFARIARAVAGEGTASVSLVQRKYNVGHARATRIVDQLAEHRVIGPGNGTASREVLMDGSEVDDLLAELGVEG